MSKKLSESRIKNSFPEVTLQPTACKFSQLEGRGGMSVQAPELGSNFSAESPEMQ